MGDQIFNEDYRIPDKFVGLVIGRGGEQIKRLQQESGCKIRIASDSDGTAERSCALSGSQFAIDQAKRMLEEIVSRGNSREGGGGGGGYRGGQGGQGGYGGQQQGGYGGGGYGQQQGGYGGYGQR